jgi:tryptophan synthase alpha chain
VQNEIIPYILVGYPTLNATEDLLRHCHSIGIRYIELGIPFTDPSADGPIIQQAAHQAVKNCPSLDIVLTLLKRLKKEKINLEITMMTYLNPIYNYGVESFYRDFSKVNVKGCLIPDLPFKERSQFDIKKFSLHYHIHQVWLVSQNLSKENLKEIILDSEFYIYLVAYLGTTGQTIINYDTIKETVNKIKSIKTIPVAIGFGIKTKENCHEILKLADGAIIGTQLIKESTKGITTAKDFLSNII